LIKMYIMKQTLLIVLAMIYFDQASAQTQYQVTNEGSTKILKGIISKDLISKDTAFQWYQANLQGFKPNAEAVKALKAKGGDLEFIVFGGTWCDDTKNLLPKYFNWLEAAEFPQEKVTLIGVDRNKKTLSHLAEALGVINVPTFIIMKNGKEIGRVVEYGKYGQPDKELGEIIANAK
jgi:thiol-disulfide isomerase/thioredoxin